jgi:hypothetical protein
MLVLSRGFAGEEQITVEAISARCGFALTPALAIYRSIFAAAYHPATKIEIQNVAI